MTTEHNDPRIIKAVEEYTAKMGNAPALFFHPIDVSEFLQANKWRYYAQNDLAMHVYIDYHNQSYQVSLVGNILTVGRADLWPLPVNNWLLNDTEVTSFKGIINALVVINGLKQDTD